MQQQQEEDLRSREGSRELRPRTYAKTVIKRNGNEVPVAFDKITRRIKGLSKGLHVEPAFVTQEVIKSMVDKMKVSEIDELAAQEAAFMVRNHVDYLTLAGRLIVSNLHKLTPSCFSEAMEMVNAQSQRYDRSDHTERFLSAEFMYQVRKHAKVLDAAIQHDADYQYDYFGIQTLLNGYLNKISETDHVVERPQYMLMRVALFLNMGDIPTALATYRMFSDKLYTHASPTLFNAGKPKAQMSSCFLLSIPNDSLESIYSTLTQCAMISKHAGGIGLSVHKIRATGALIKSSGGQGDGLVPMLRVFNNTARYVNQGGKRKGAFAIYLEPWHADILAFIDLKKNRGNEDERARDLHYAMWVPDLFMSRVERDEPWSLFSPDVAPGLYDVYGADFDALYTQYERQGLARKTLPARKIWEAILNSQIETGEPYLLYKDACNAKSNQKNLGTIQCSNLCCEILEYTSQDEIAVCNLVSLCLPSFIDATTSAFDFQKLYDVVYLATQNLNRVIDLNFYPVKEGQHSNLRHRPIGIGVQGLADVFCMLLMPFESDPARQLNRDIFETIYFAAVTSSNDLARQFGPYETFAGSPASQGILQFDMWNVTPSSRWNWAQLKDNIKSHGLRNSLLVALMPTASTAQIMGNNEGCEPYTRNLYVRRTDAGEFIVVNRHLAKLLSDQQLWTPEIIEQIVAHDGSIQSIEAIPEALRQIFKTTFEVKSRPIVDMAADRGPFICQTQSMNLWVESPTLQLLNSIHFYSWKKGLKTGMYYLRSKALTGAQKVVLDPTKKKTATPAVDASDHLTQPAQPLPVHEPNEFNEPKEPKEPKVYQKDGKTYVCTDDICISCGS